jgi:hypothetical protein
VALTLQVEGNNPQQELKKDEEHQVQPPDFNINAKGDGIHGNDDEGVDTADRDDADGQHEDPLELKQMAPPFNKEEGQGQGEQEVNMQQQQPINVRQISAV